MDRIFGDTIGKSELAALRALLSAHAAVGVDFAVDGTGAKPFATVTLVWPAAKAPSEAASAPWIISERVVGRPQFQSLVRTLFIEGSATKALHRVSVAAHWMATHGLAHALSAVRNVVDLQLYYEHVADTRTRMATLSDILAAASSVDATISTGSKSQNTPTSSSTSTTSPTTTHALYRNLVSEQLTATFVAASDAPSTAIKSKPRRSPSSSLTRTLLQHSVQRAHLCLVCLDRILLKHCGGDHDDAQPEPQPTTTISTSTTTATKTITKSELMALTLRRVVNASRLPPSRELVWFAKNGQYAARSLALVGDDAHVGATVQRVKRHCDIEPLLALLPPSLYESIVAIHDFEDRLVAISLVVGAKPKAYVVSTKGTNCGEETECVELHKSPTPPTPSNLFGAFRKKPTVELDRGELSHDELAGILAMAGGDAAIDANNRVRVDRQLHRLAVVRSTSDQIVGLTMRVGRTVQFASNLLLDLLHSPTHRTKSVLVVGGSGAGKTSLLRDIARRLSTTSERVCIVDTTNEIGGDGAIMHRSVDRTTRFMVKALDANADAIVESVQNHLVDTLIVDEVVSDRDARALAFAKNHCRRRVMAGCAVRDLRALVDNPEFQRLAGGVRTAVASPPTNSHPPNEFYGDFVVTAKPAFTVDKTRTPFTALRERVTTPIVDVVVELNAARVGECRIVWDVARAVDDVLAGRVYAYETRLQTPELLGVQVVTE